MEVIKALAGIEAILWREGKIYARHLEMISKWATKGFFYFRCLKLEI